MSDADSKKSFHEEVAEKLIDQLKLGVAPWQRPWAAGQGADGLPTNPTTGKRYKGMNTVVLMMQGRDDPRWMTYNQAKAVGAQVRRGEKGTTCQKWIFSQEQNKIDDAGKPVLDSEGKPEKVTVLLERPILSLFKVFNAEQIDGLPELMPRTLDWDPIQRAESLLAASGARIYHDGKGAYYSPVRDDIHLPKKEQFPVAANYYATALHELGHWTGHESRLNRDLSNPFGSEGYAKEELRAEIASMILGRELGIGHDPEQHVAYVASWIKVLNDDPLEIFRAAVDAEKAYMHVLSLENQQAQEVIQTPVAVEIPIRDIPEQQPAMNQTESPSLVTNMRDDATSDQGTPALETGPVYLDVPFKEKNQVKELGARWDRARRSWYVPAGVNLVPFAKWQEGAVAVQEQTPSANKDEIGSSAAAERQYLAVPYGERAAAKVAGARWDQVAKSWYAGPDADAQKVERWRIDPTKAEQAPAMDPVAEFSDALRSIGCDPERHLENGQRHPIMDGKKHRIALESDKGTEKNGVYFGFLDGVKPAGYAKNHRTGVDIKWKAKGYSLTPEQQAQLRAQAAETHARREAEQQQAHAAAQDRVNGQIGRAQPVEQPTPYLVAKGCMKVKAGLFTDAEGKDTFIPAYDIDGKVWTMQYINEDGTKRFAKNSRKEGAFHVVGGLEALKDAPAIVISEGYATAWSVSEGVEYATVAAFDAGNLEHVARALHTKYPDKPIIIAGDDDLATEKKEGINPGREGARKAASAVGGKTVFPIFAPGEQASDNKLFTDFNDLATRSKLGMDAVRRQVKAVVEEAVRQYRIADGVDDATQAVSVSTLAAAQAQRTEQASLEQQLLNQAQPPRKGAGQEALRAKQVGPSDMSQQLASKEEREAAAQGASKGQDDTKQRTQGRGQRQSRSMSR